MAGYYPIFVDLNDRPCVVVGGGEVAERKIKGLLKSNARVTVVAPKLSSGIAALGRAKKIVILKRKYKRGDLADALVAIGASDDAKVNLAVHREAVLRRISVNIVDEPGLCSFIVPSVIRRGDLVIAISTSGGAPALAKKIRLEIEALIGKEYGQLLKIIGPVRRNLLKKGVNRVKKERVIKELLDSSMLANLKKGPIKDIRARIENITAGLFAPEKKDKGPKKSKR